jgi:intergrase/recombinase
VPTFSDEHGGLESAVEVENPTKSWVLYDKLENNEDVRYYRLELKKGDRLRLILFSPEQDFVLSMVVMGPGITSEGVVPEFIETVNVSNSHVVIGERLKKHFH